MNGWAAFSEAELTNCGADGNAASKRIARGIMRSSGDDSKAKNRNVHHVAHTRRDGGDAFIKDPWGGRAPAHTNVELAESLAEQFVGSVTTAQSSDARDDISLTEEVGGPFVTTRAKLEFARGVDKSNPADAEQEALPMVVFGFEDESSDQEEEES
jgi:hypothetical protein